MTNNAVNVGIVAGGNQTYTFPAATSTLATIALSETLTSKTLTSPVVSGAGGTTAGQQGYNATDKALLVGDGTANQSIFTSAWKAFTPTLSNVTLGNGTLSGAYCQIGKFVAFRVYFKFGSTSSITGLPNLTPPVACFAYPGLTSIAQNRMSVTGTAYNGLMNNSFNVQVSNVSGTYMTQSGVSSTVPATWATNDELEIQGFYEAA